MIPSKNNHGRWLWVPGQARDDTDYVAAPVDLTADDGSRTLRQLIHRSTFKDCIDDIAFGGIGAGPSRPPRQAVGFILAIALLLCASLLVALEAPSKPFLDKNSFYLSSAGFRVQVANDEAGRRRCTRCRRIVS